MSGSGPTSAAAQVKLAYQGVIEDVVKSVRELFLNDGVDEQVLSDLKDIWETKLDESGVMNHPPPLIPKHKPPPQQQSWNLHHHQSQHQQQSPQHSRRQQQQHQQQQHHQQQQQQQVPSVLPSTTSAAGSHNPPPPSLTSISNTLPVPPVVSHVTSAETTTTSTAVSSAAQSNAALLQSNIVSAAASGSVIPNLQYMLPGTAQGANPGYTFIVDPQTRMPIMVPLATVANLQMAKQLQALQQQTAAAVAAATRSGTGISSSSAGQQFSVIQNPALSAMAAAAMGGDVTVASAASQQSKNSQSQSSTDSSQVDGTQPVLNTDMTFSPDQLVCEQDEQSLLHKDFQIVKSKQLLQEECHSSSLSDSNCVSKKKIKFTSSTDHTAAESLKSYDVTIGKADATTRTIPQLDGANQESSEEEESEDSEEEDEIVNQGAAEGDDEPLNSDDDDESQKSDDDEKFETENIIVCQFDKVTRTRIGGRNRWKFHLKDGIMNLDGRDYVFQKATGEADW